MICIKVKYTTEKFAIQDIARIKKKSTRKKIPCRAYLCQCGFWHLTSKIDRKDDEILELKNQIRSLKLEVQKLTQKERNEEIKESNIDKRVKKLNHTLAERNKTITRLRNDNSDLISKNIQLEKKLSQYSGEIIGMNY